MFGEVAEILRIQKGKVNNVSAVSLLWGDGTELESV